MDDNKRYICLVGTKWHIFSPSPVRFGEACQPQGSVGEQTSPQDGDIILLEYDSLGMESPDRYRKYLPGTLGLERVGSFWDDNVWRVVAKPEPVREHYVTEEEALNMHHGATVVLMTRRETDVWEFDVVGLMRAFNRPAVERYALAYAEKWVEENGLVDMGDNGYQELQILTVICMRAYGNGYGSAVMIVTEREDDDERLEVTPVGIVFADTEAEAEEEALEWASEHADVHGLLPEQHMHIATIGGDKVIRYT